jgi:hypothetical protein
MHGSVLFRVQLIANIYEHVSFLGDLHRQIASSSEGSKVRLQVNPPRPDLK